MFIYSLTCLTGLAALVLLLSTLRQEQLLRHLRFQNALHTRLVMLSPPNGVPIQWELSAVHYILGRRKRKADINLDVCRDGSIGRVHARLWYDGQDFCLAPLPSSSNRAQPALTHVNGVPLDFSGVVLHNGDVIRMGSSNFQILDTKE